MEYFILGILFIFIVLPFLQGVSAIIAQEAEYIQTVIAAKTYKIKKQLGDEQQEEQQEPDKHYGFYSCPQPQPVKSQDENQDDEEII